jgi:hypothetical protein
MGWCSQRGSSAQYGVVGFSGKGEPRPVREFWYHTVPISPPGLSFMVDFAKTAKARVVVVRPPAALKGTAEIDGKPVRSSAVNNRVSHLSGSS